MLSFPNCKINIGLYITNRREDGYHDLDTVFYPLTSLHDALEIIPAEHAALHISGRTVSGNKGDNLVWKAYKLLQTVFPDSIGELDIYLLKAIPMGAGLGGGSADGAFMLQLLNDYFELGLDKEQLIVYALQLGSDCPFFIQNSPQYATGRGEVMKPLPIDLSNYSIRLVCPDVHISTAKAFQMITPRKAAFDLNKLVDIPITEWQNHVVNDFEQPVFDQYPVLADIKQQLYNQGALYASMSGTGSTIYGIFSKHQKVDLNISGDVSVFQHNSAGSL